MKNIFYTFYYHQSSINYAMYENQRQQGTFKEQRRKKQSPYNPIPIRLL